MTAASRTAGPTLYGIFAAHLAVLAALFGLSQAQALLVLFVLLPFAVAGVVIPFVAWRSSGQPAPVRTSEILTHGDPGEAEVLTVRVLGGVLDLRPMVRFVLRVRAAPDETPFELEVVQSLPRVIAREFRAGDTVAVRVTADRSAGAVVWGGPPTP